MVPPVLSLNVGRNEISTSLLLKFWFCQCRGQCTLGSERVLKTSITHIPTWHIPLSCRHKCSICCSSHYAKVVSLPPHHPDRARRRFHVPHKALYDSPTEWVSWPFCLLEVHLVARPSSYWKSQLPQGLMGWIDALRRFSSDFFFYHFPCGGKTTIDQKNAPSR